MPYGDYTEENRFGELKNCNDPRFEAKKSSSRPQDFCKRVKMESTLKVEGKTTLNKTEIIPPAITVGGHTFRPQYVDLVVGISGGGGSVPEGGGSISPPKAITQTFLLLVAEEG